MTTSFTQNQDLSVAFEEIKTPDIELSENSNLFQRVCGEFAELLHHKFPEQGFLVIAASPTKEDTATKLSAIGAMKHQDLMNLIQTLFTQLPKPKQMLLQIQLLDTMMGGRKDAF